MFASNIHRLQQVFDQAERLGRRVVVDGRSMIKNADVATRLGHLRYPTGLRIAADEMADYEPDELVIVTTGSQGEPMSALTRMSVGEHRQIPIAEGDTVVLSATPIPGNEAAIWRTVNNLFRLGAVVVYSAVDMVHVSGHGNQEELKLMLSLTRPEHVVPYHGEPRHQYIFKQLAVQAEVKPENVHLLQPYDVLEISPRGVRLVDRLPGEPMLVDGAGVGDVGASVLRERRALSEDGVVFVSAVIDTSSREILDGPAIESRGFVYVDESEDLIDGALDVATDAILGADTDTQTDEVERELKSSVSRYFRSHTGRRPLIIPMLFEVDAAAPLNGQSEDPR
jgi:ribonuclease J